APSFGVKKVRPANQQDGPFLVFVNHGILKFYYHDDTTGHDVKENGTNRPLRRGPSCRRGKFFT
ncbi:MAG: hypothetical protein ABIQ93_15185, partial [Saprospiraceae bacterium]